MQLCFSPQLFYTDAKLPLSLCLSPFVCMCIVSWCGVVCVCVCVWGGGISTLGKQLTMVVGKWIVCKLWEKNEDAVDLKNTQLFCDPYLSLFLENISGRRAQAINEDTWSPWLTQSSVKKNLLSFLYIFFIWILLFIYLECCLIWSQTLWAGSVIIYTYLCVLLFSNLLQLAFCCCLCWGCIHYRTSDYTIHV